MLLRLLVLLALAALPLDGALARSGGVRIVRVAKSTKAKSLRRASNPDAERARLLRAEALIRKALPDICRGC
jgi:hypothetical protein